VDRTLRRWCRGVGVASARGPWRALSRHSSPPWSWRQLSCHRLGLQRARHRVKLGHPVTAKCPLVVCGWGPNAPISCGCREPRRRRAVPVERGCGASRRSHRCVRRVGSSRLPVSGDRARITRQARRWTSVQRRGADLVVPSVAPTRQVTFCHRSNAKCRRSVFWCTDASVPDQVWCSV